MHRNIFVFLVIVSSMTVSYAKESKNASNYLERVEVNSFIEEFSKKNKIEKSSLITLFENVQTQTDVLEAIQRPAEKKKNWTQYRKIFITDKRIQQGLEFWSENAQILAAAERAYGVPPEIIVAIIGVETFYGRYKGKHPVLDSLVTLGFDYPPRQKFFRSELEHFLLLTREEDLDPLKIKGSYAGAMGKSQFISSSYRNYAVDFDEDGVRDLWDSNEDVIGSVANYFKRHGWRQDAVVTLPATINSNNLYKTLLKKGLKPSVALSELKQYGVEFDYQGDHGEKSTLLELKKDDENEYWIGLNNFYVITRYNHSHMYAMAVYQLSQKIKHEIKDYVAKN